jgi:tetratricopeptide (TPR) repeat protein
LANSNYYKWNFKFADSLYKVLRKRGFKYVYDQHLNLMFGRNDLVIKNARKLFREDQYNTMGSHMTCAYAYYYKGQIDSTLYMIREGLQIHPFQEGYYDHFGNLYIAMGDYKKAKNLIEKGLEISDQRHASMLVHLAIVYHYLGDEEKSLSYLNEVIDRAKAGEPEINVFLPHYYARIGNLNEAFKWLDIAYKKHEVDLIWLKADPNLVLLKEDPRYEILCEKIGFSKIE